MATVLNGKAKTGKPNAAKRRFDVGGVWLDQPFKIRRLNHYGIYVNEPAKSLAFYHDLLGFRVSDPGDFSRRITDEKLRASLGDGTAYFMHHNTDHHTFVIMPKRHYMATADTAKRWP